MRAPPALFGLEQRRKRDLQRAAADRLDVVEGPDARRRHAEAAQRSPVEVERRKRCVGVGERGLLEVDRGVAHAAALERLEERLLPLGVLEKDGEFRTLGSHDRHVGAKVAACK
jgi:hypothetical protein